MHCKLHSQALRIGGNRTTGCTTLEWPCSTGVYAQPWGVTPRRVRVWHLEHSMWARKENSFRTVATKARFQEVKKPWVLFSRVLCSCCPISLLSRAPSRSLFMCVHILHGSKYNTLCTTFCAWLTTKGPGGSFHLCLLRAFWFFYTAAFSVWIYYKSVYSHWWMFWLFPVSHFHKIMLEW